jgi:type IV pilus assembly protein PilV
MRSAAAGFTLIEVLIAVLVLGIGLLGVAGLQSVALSMNQGSYVRTQATVLARDISDRMRTNRQAATDAAYDMSGGASASEQTACETTSGCNPSALAGHDLYRWNQSVAATLPNGEAHVCIDSTPDGTGTPAAPACDGSGENYAVKIWWYDKEAEDQQLFVTVMRP